MGADTAAGSDAAAAPAFSSADSGSAAEAQALTISALDTAVFNEAAAIAVMASDAGTALDIAVLGLFSADTAAAADTGYQSGPIGPDFDYGTFTDSQTGPATVGVVVLGMDVSTEVTGVQVITVVSGAP
jgi:hypothetical protein